MRLRQLKNSPTLDLGSHLDNIGGSDAEVIQHIALLHEIAQRH